MKNTDTKLLLFVIAILFAAMLWQSLALHRSFKNERYLSEQLQKARAK